MKVCSNTRESKYCCDFETEMLKGYDYLFKGAEFDRRLLEYAGLEELVYLLTSRGKLVSSSGFPGREALHHMHFFPMDQCPPDNGYPNLVMEMLAGVRWQLHQPYSDGILSMRAPTSRRLSRSVRRGVESSMSSWTCNIVGDAS
ncbi:hypothetical protein F2981_21700 (plasmid) [Sinorhizobium meliloti]|nr:hypothetical protein [Sinorhizobium meliloti]